MLEIASSKTILDTELTEYYAMFEIGTISHFHLVKEFLPMMTRNNHGHIITTSSMASFVTFAAICPTCKSSPPPMPFIRV